jgi:hypothetical protein
VGNVSASSWGSVESAAISEGLLLASEHGAGTAGSSSWIDCFTIDTVHFLATKDLVVFEDFRGGRPTFRRFFGLVA